ncbi:MAG: hypothetical protein WC435_00075 [Candidatus Paceibacterota bacterium]
MRIWVTEHAIERYEKWHNFSFGFFPKNPKKEIFDLFNVAKPVRTKKVFPPTRKIPEGEECNPVKVYKSGEWTFFVTWSEKKKRMVIMTIVKGKIFGRKKRKR